MEQHHFIFIFNKTRENLEIAGKLWEHGMIGIGGGWRTAKLAAAAEFDGGAEAAEL